MKPKYLAVFLQLLCAALPAGAVTVGLSGPSGASQPVGTGIDWTASNIANDGATLQYRWVIAQNGLNVVYRDFGTTAAIRYAPMQEGAYSVTVTARNAANFADTGEAVATYTATSLLAAGGAPTVTATSNPLVAIYSATCTSGTMRVFFAPQGTPLISGVATPSQTCVPGQSVNFQIAGMRADTTYTMSHQLFSDFAFTSGPELQFRTGSIPPDVTLPTMTVTGVSQGEPVVLNSYIGNVILPVAYDTSGNVIWYNSPVAPGGINQLMRPMNGGTMVLAQSDILQEVDLLGNIVRETNINRVTEQLSGAPYNIVNPSIPNRVADFNHEAVRLPNGYTATLSVIEQIADQGQGPADVLGDLIVVFDQNYQVVWVWNSFAHLDLQRKATLNDTCVTGTNGCPVLTLLPAGQVANDWIHANAVGWTGDGNLLLSMRHQDWVIKIDYANGTGTGNVLWRLGNQGDFALTSGTWFSHQHDAKLTGTEISLFDNANGDYAMFNGSRGLIFTIDEAALTASLISEARMNTYSSAVGSAQTLLNNDLYFLSGVPVANPDEFSQAIEFSPGPGDVSPLAFFTTNNRTYRSFRMKDLYTP